MRSLYSGVGGKWELQWMFAIAWQGKHFSLYRCQSISCVCVYNFLSPHQVQPWHTMRTVDPVLTSNRCARLACSSNTDRIEQSFILQLRSMTLLHDSYCR